MNPLITETLYYLGSILFFSGAFFFGLNWLSSGWMFAFMRVKATRGKRTMAICHDIGDTYFKIGKFDNGAFVFKDRAKKSRTYPNISRDDIIHFTGVNAIQIDLKHDLIIKRSGEYVPGADAQTVSALLTRVIMANSILDTKEKLIILLIIAAIIAAIASAYLGYMNHTEIMALGQLTGNI